MSFSLITPLVPSVMVDEAKEKFAMKLRKVNIDVVIMKREQEEEEEEEEEKEEERE